MLKMEFCYCNSGPTFAFLKYRAACFIDWLISKTVSCHKYWHETIAHHNFYMLIRLVSCLTASSPRLS